MTFTVYRDRRGLWRWRLRARNHRIIADGGEGYSRKRRCLEAVERVQWGCWKAEIDVAGGRRGVDGESGGGRR